MLRVTARLSLSVTLKKAILKPNNILWIIYATLHISLKMGKNMVKKIYTHFPMSCKMEFMFLQAEYILPGMVKQEEEHYLISKWTFWNYQFVLDCLKGQFIKN